MEEERRGEARRGEARLTSSWRSAEPRPGAVAWHGSCLGSVPEPLQVN